MIRVVAIDDHPLILRAIADELAKYSDMELVGTTNTGKKLYELVDEKLPDVVILDLGLDRGEFNPIVAVQRLVECHPSISIVILTGDDNPIYIRAIIACGAMGYVLKDDNLSLTLAEAIRKVYAGERYYSKTVWGKLLPSKEENYRELSNREIEVLRLVAQGKQNSAIAEVLNLSEGRIRNILSHIYEKLDVQENDGENNPRVTLLNKARKIGLL